MTGVQTCALPISPGRIIVSIRRFKRFAKRFREERCAAFLEYGRLGVSWPGKIAIATKSFRSGRRTEQRRGQPSDNCSDLHEHLPLLRGARSRTREDILVPFIAGGNRSEDSVTGPVFHDFAGPHDGPQVLPAFRRQRDVLQRIGSISCT